MDKLNFNMGIRQIQMAHGGAIDDEVAKFYFETIQGDCAPSNQQWNEAVRQLVRTPFVKPLRLPQILMVVQKIVLDDQAKIDIRERQKELEWLRAEYDDETVRAIKEKFIVPLIKHLSDWGREKD